MQSRVPMQPFSLRIHIPTQRMDLRGADERIIRSYSISTSRFGSGSTPGSFQTPVGNFVVAEKIGAGAEPGMIFRSRVATGRIGSGNEPDDFVQTRILWLAGLDEANANTHERYIYLHGTNQEQQIGTPSSHGCVRMVNQDIVELFDLIQVGIRVTIEGF